MTLFGICAHSVSNALLFFDTIIQKDIDFLGAGLREKESSRDVVSEADYAIQRIVLDEIKEIDVPHHFGRERNDLRHLKTSEYCWAWTPSTVRPISPPISHFSECPLAYCTMEALCWLFRDAPHQGAFLHD